MRRERSYLGPISQPRKIRDYCIEQLERLNIKQKQEHNKKESVRENIKNEK